MWPCPCGAEICLTCVFGPKHVGNVHLATCILGLGEILEKMKICTWNSGSHFFSVINFVVPTSDELTYVIYMSYMSYICHKSNWSILVSK